MARNVSSPSTRERRSEPRLSCNNASAELTILSGSGGIMTTIPAMIVNISKSGLRLLANTRVGPGLQVRVKMDKLLIFGEARHCHAKGPMFESGVQISEVVGVNGLCKRLTDEQIELLALGCGLGVKERLYANLHVRRCEKCAEQLRATKTFLEKSRCA